MIPSPSTAYSLTRLLFTQDDYGGLLPRWHISYNISMLRLISFNMEYYWAWSAKIAENEGEAGEGLPEPPTSPRVKVSEALEVREAVLHTCVMLTLDMRVLAGRAAVPVAAQDLFLDSRA